MNRITLLSAPIPLHQQYPFPNNSANGTFLVDEEPEDACSLNVTLPAKRKFQAPANETRELSIARPITTAIDTANALLHASSNTSADFQLRHNLVFQALAIGRSLSVEIANPLSVVRPHAQDIQSTKELLLCSHSAMIQILCHHNYLDHRELIHNHIKHIIRLLGHKMLYNSHPRVGVIWPTIVNSLGKLKWTIPQRMHEWIRIASTVPTDDYFVANRFYSHLSCIRMEIDNVETCLAEGNLDETMETITVMQYPIDIFTRCLEIISSVEGRKFLPQVREWKDPQHYYKLGEPILTRYSKIKRDVETKILLRQGDTLLNIVTDRVRETNADYFMFQAMLALDAYRMAYQKCSAFEEVNFDLEGFCLWSMGRVLGKYLGLEEHAHDLLLQAVAMVTMVSALLPRSEWYTDAVEQIQQYRKKLEDEESIDRQRERAGMLEQLTVELFELRSRAERVFDEYSLREFFQWLLRAHRPRYSSKTEIGGDILESRELSKVVLKVIAVYDVPDKRVCDELWIVLSEEIIKTINRFFGSSGAVFFGGI